MATGSGTRRKKKQDRLLAQIAAITNQDLEEITEVHDQSHRVSYDETIMEMQSVISFYRTRIEPKEPKQKTGENAIDFAKRYTDWENAYNQWRFRKCEGCNLTFAYSYPFEGVKFCSMDCLDTELQKIGLRVTPGRDLKKRWGTQYPGSGIPAIVPSSALKSLLQVAEICASYDDADSS